MAHMIDARTTVGPVELGVADLGRSLTYYTQAIGLRVLAEGGGRATLGVGDLPLVRLVEVPGASPAPRATGLFHLALLVPDRPSLARWLAHATRTRVPLQGASDHFVSEAIYLGDPDGHGIEVYRDRPREHWEGQVARMSTLPLDAADLMGELDDPATEPFEGLPAGTTMGHIHLQVRDVPEAIGFYRDVVGLDLMATYGPQAAFLSAGGYHHHVGANTWNSQGSGPAPEGAATLRHATLVLPDADALGDVLERLAAAGVEVVEREGGRLVRDPSGVPLLLTTGT
jgi:catechol 2,3-dioxygenase